LIVDNHTAWSERGPPNGMPVAIAVFDGGSWSPTSSSTSRARRRGHRMKSLPFDFNYCAIAHGGSQPIRLKCRQ
jgi:hypothetical protein